MRNVIIASSGYVVLYRHGDDAHCTHVTTDLATVQDAIVQWLTRGVLI